MIINATWEGRICVALTVPLPAIIPSVEPARPLRVMSYNIWNYNGEWSARLRMIAQVVRESNADIVLWQEVRSAPDGRHQMFDLYSALPELAFHCYHPAMSYPDGYREGLGIMSRLPIVEYSVLKLPSFIDGEDAHQRAVLRAAVLTPRGVVDVMSTHLSLSDIGRPRQTKQIAQWRPTQRPQILGGDFNAEPDSPSLLPLLDAGYSDAWQAATLRPGTPCGRAEDDRAIEQGFTFPSWEPIKRIDFIMSRGAALTPRTLWLHGRCGLGHPQRHRHASDHRAIVVEFEIN